MIMSINNVSLKLLSLYILLCICIACESSDSNSSPEVTSTTSMMIDQGVVDFSDYVIEVPQFGTKHSLNVSVCCGVVLWEFAKKWIVKL